MKKILLAIVFISLLIVVPSASAKSWVNQDSREESLEERARLRQQWREGAIEAGEKLGELHALNLSKRNDLYYNRLVSILARLDQAIKNAEVKYGVSKLEKSRSFYTQAKSKLDSAKSQADAAITAFRNISGGKVSEARASLFSSREKAKNAWETYKEAVKLMKQSAQELRRVIRANMPTPSPRASASPLIPPPIN